MPVGAALHDLGRNEMFRGREYKYLAKNDGIMQCLKDSSSPNRVVARAGCWQKLGLVLLLVKVKSPVPLTRRRRAFACFSNFPVPFRGSTMCCSIHSPRGISSSFRPSPFSRLHKSVEQSDCPVKTHSNPPSHPQDHRNRARLSPIPTRHSKGIGGSSID